MTRDNSTAKQHIGPLLGFGTLANSAPKADGLGLRTGQYSWSAHWNFGPSAEQLSMQRSPLERYSQHRSIRARRYSE